MITLVDYGLGNILAFANIYKRLNVPVVVAQSVDQLVGAQRLILPGVGAFDWAMERLVASGMRDCLDELVLIKRRPVLGVCVGMQMVARCSEEGVRPGLGWLEAEVRRFDKRNSTQKTSLPHMGWNDVSPVVEKGLFEGIASPRFYFLHSYHFIPGAPEQTLAITEYGSTFTPAIRRHNIFGVQFHPEKSHHWGVQLLKNFADL